MKHLAFGAMVVNPRGAENCIGPVARDQALPLSYAQQRLWRLDQRDRSVGYHFTAIVELRGVLDRKVLRAALDQIVARHELLRTTFHSVGGEPVQVIVSADRGFALVEQEVEARWVIGQITQQQALDPFDLSRGPPIRGRLLRVSQQEHVLLITQHHIISDAKSIAMLLQELATLYDALATGQTDPLPPLELQYADYASWQQQQMTADMLNSQLKFWTQNLSDAPEPIHLPTDRPRRVVRFYSCDRVPLSLSVELTERLRGFVQQHGLTLFSMLLSGLAVLLGRWSGQDEVVIGARIENRQNPQLEPLIGCFENTVPVRVRLQEDPTTWQLLRQTTTTMSEARAHQEVPLEQMREALKVASGHDPVFQVTMGLDDTPSAIVTLTRQHLPRLKWSDVSIEKARMQSELSLSLRQAGEGLIGTLEYASDLFERATIERMAASWGGCLRRCWRVLRSPSVACL